ncbi:uncharacterized protein LOC127288369 [Leptopilina boulardi]|uniref:uncharacterized protein LOC127288369 n=1 Tax=Leptopilina boulardi TaxID=63433 RepID=UPI0021F516A7|nr:uncharacterized protein LOC127288369 [Leptopilina boulardi]
MIKISFIFFAYISITNAILVNRTNYINWVQIRRGEEFQGVRVRQINGGYIINWLEDYDDSANSLKVYFNYIFEKSGSREIINVKNLCGTEMPGTLEFAVQQHMLTKFATTKQCPIKKGTQVIFRLPDTYTWETKNHECGWVDGSSYISKTHSRRNDHTPLLLRIHFTGYVTGPNCLN